ncbi:MAG: glycoside hydrolase family 92 protein, partial [Thermoanaerobaculia bacterium]|nr:glycoside hydrolase family 92 protein [Thermoanaerobaculia bacterium]
MEQITGDAVRGRLLLKDGGQPVVMRVALSYTAMAGAWRNMKAECGPVGFDFDRVREEAREQWNQWLSRVPVNKVESGHLPRFYTDLFFALAGRRTCSDFDGAWLDSQPDQPVVRQIPLDPVTGRPRHRHFNSDAWWGAQWSILPLWLKFYPEVIRDFCRMFLRLLPGM